MKPTLFDGERLDLVNDKLSLIQKRDGLTFGTDALLLAAYVSGTRDKGLELGSGTGIISLLLLSRNKLKTVRCAEVQPSYATLTERNAALNSLDARLEVLCTDIRSLPSREEYDTVFTNPPYMKSDSGKANLADEKNIARHEVFGGIEDFVLAAKRTLKFGGAFYAVYRTDRLIDLISCMRECAIEPKRITLVHADTKSEPSMALVEGKRGGASGLYMTPPLIIYADGEHRTYSCDMEYILEHGSFPSEFIRRGARNGTDKK